MSKSTSKPKAPRRLLSSGMPGADYGVFLLAVPLIGAACLLTVALAAHSWGGFVTVLLLTVVISGLLSATEVFQAPDAWENDSPLKNLSTWFAAVALLWPLGYPLYLRERKRFKLPDWFLAALVVEALFLAAVGGALVINITGYGKAPPESATAQDKNAGLLAMDPRWVPDADDIEIVKTGHLDNCPTKNLEQEVAGFFETPRWQAGASSDGTDFVNASGILTYQGKPATAVLQFVMDKDKSGFKYQAFAINDVPQPIYIAAFTLAQMCE